MANHTPAILTPRQVAEALHVSVSTLADWRVNGDGPPHIKLGRHLVAYRSGDLQAWIDALPTRQRTSGPNDSHTGD